MSIDGWMNKPNMINAYNGILFSLKKAEKSLICYNTDVPWGHSAKWNKPVKKRQIQCDSTYMRY